MIHFLLIVHEEDYITKWLENTDTGFDYCHLPDVSEDISEDVKQNSTDGLQRNIQKIKLD